MKIYNAVIWEYLMNDYIYIKFVLHQYLLPLGFFLSWCSLGHQMLWDTSIQMLRDTSIHLVLLCVCLSVWTRLSSVGRKLEKDECSPMTPATEITTTWDHDIQLLLQRQLPLPGGLCPSPVQSVTPTTALLSGDIRTSRAKGTRHWHSDHCPVLPVLLLTDHLPLSVLHGHGQPGVWPIHPLDIWSHFCPGQHKWTRS